MGIGFAAKIVAVIIKSAVNSKISGELSKELIGASIDGVSEKGITEINKFISSKKSNINYALSDENLKSKGVDKSSTEFVREELRDFLWKIDNIDGLLADSRYDVQNLNKLLWECYCETKIYVENESDMKVGIFSIAQMLITLGCESKEFVEKLLIHISGSVDDIKDDFSNMMKRFDRLEESNGAILSKVSENFSTSNKDKVQRKIESRAQEYADKVEINAYGNAKVNIANDNGKLVAVQKNNHHEKNNKIKNRISKKVITLKASLTIIAVILIILFINYFNAYSLYNCYMDDAGRLKETHEYKQASEKYLEALNKSKKILLNNDLYVRAACNEADCYFLLALNENDDDIALEYYAKARKKYREIIDDKKNGKSDYYVSALAGLSYVYNFTEHKLDEEWALIIEKIVKIIKNHDEVNVAKNNDFDDVSLHRWIKVYSALGDYYYSAIQADYSMMYNPTVAYAALESFEKYDELLSLANKKGLEVATIIDPIYNARILAELMIFIAESLATKNVDQFAEKAINLCQSYLDNASINIGKDVESYIYFKSLIADGYRVLGKYYSDNEEKAKEYMKKAYDELEFLLKMENETIQLNHIIDVGYSAIFTGFCSNEDLEIILENYQKLLSQYNIRENPKETALYSLNICDACMAVIEYYGYSKQAWEMGQYISEEVKNVEEYVQKTQKGRFQEYYNYFHQDIEIVKQKSISISPIQSLINDCQLIRK